MQLIRDRFHVVYHPDHVARLLRACGFTPQRPQRTAKERVDQRIRFWLQHDWVQAKRLSRLRARLICLDETGFLMAPLLRRTWVLRGNTPMLPLRTRAHEKVSAIGALVASPRRQITSCLALDPGLYSIQ